MSVNYKFKSQKGYESVEVDGPFINCHDLKVQIVQRAKLDQDPNFDLELTNDGTKEVYSEGAMIAKSTNVIVRRVPVKAQRRRFDNSTSSAPAPTGRSNISMGNSTPSISSSTSLMPLLAGGVSENDRIEALVSQGPGWSQGQAVPQQARFLQNSSKTPPPHYVCHRCQQGGHWISACPTNGDTAFDFRRIKKATGIPKSFLETVSESDAGDGSVMMTEGGGFAKVRTMDGDFGEMAWATQELELEKVTPKYQCSICEGMIVNAVTVPCCSINYCDKCVRKHFLKSDFKCPGCTTQISPDALIPNKALRAEIEASKRQRLQDLIAARKNQKVNENSQAQGQALGQGARGGHTHDSLVSLAPIGTPIFGVAPDGTKTSVISDPVRGTVTEYHGLDYKYEEVQRGQFTDKFIDGERVCRDYDSGHCRFGDACTFMHPSKAGRDLRGTKEERQLQAQQEKHGRSNVTSGGSSGSSSSSLAPSSSSSSRRSGSRDESDRRKEKKSSSRSHSSSHARSSSKDHDSDRDRRRDRESSSSRSSRDSSRRKESSSRDHEHSRDRDRESSKRHRSSSSRDERDSHSRGSGRSRHR